MRLKTTVPATRSCLQGAGILLWASLVAHVRFRTFARPWGGVNLWTGGHSVGRDLGLA